MRKRTLLITLLIALGCILISLNQAYSADVAKIGVFDFQKFFEKSEVGKAAQLELSGAGKKMEKDLKEKGKEIEDLKKRLEREVMVMDKQMREQSEREYRIKINDYKMLQKKYADAFKKLQASIVKKLQKDIAAVVKKTGEKGGYLMIVQKPGVLYYPASIDITDSIIKKINLKSNKKK
jgi:outer membrane protein